MRIWATYIRLISLNLRLKLANWGGGGRGGGGGGVGAGPPLPGPALFGSVGLMNLRTCRPDFLQW